MMNRDEILRRLARLLDPESFSEAIEDIDALEAAGVRTVIADPRRYLAAAGPAYDLILVGMPEPESAQANRFYTREFYARCAASPPNCHATVALPACARVVRRRGHRWSSSTTRSEMSPGKKIPRPPTGGKPARSG